MGTPSQNMLTGCRTAQGKVRRAQSQSDRCGNCLKLSDSHERGMSESQAPHTPILPDGAPVTGIASRAPSCLLVPVSWPCSARRRVSGQMHTKSHAEGTLCPEVRVSALVCGIAQVLWLVRCGFESLLLEYWSSHSYQSKKEPKPAVLEEGKEHRRGLSRKHLSNPGPAEAQRVQKSFPSILNSLYRGEAQAMVEMLESYSPGLLTQIV